MPLIDRIRRNFRAHHNRRNQPTDEHNHSENVGSFFEGSSEPGFTSFENTSLPGGRIFQETFTLSSTTRQSRYTHGENAEHSYSFTSTSNSTTTNHRFLGTGTSRVASTSNQAPTDFSDLADDDETDTEPRSAYSTSHDPSTIRHNHQQQNNRGRSRISMHHQSMNNRRRNNSFQPTNHVQFSAEHLEHIINPLERVHARQYLPALNISIPEQASHQTAGYHENFDVNFSHRPHNPDFEDSYADGRLASHSLGNLPELAEESEEDRRHLAYYMRFQAQHLPIDHHPPPPPPPPPPHHHHHHHHHHANFHEILSDQVTNSVNFEDNAMVTAIKLALVPTADTENDSCTVCQELYDMEEHKSVRVPGCVHILGGKCILRWLKENTQNMTCPMCRNQIETPML